MARTRDFLDEWAEWYSLPESSTGAGPRTRALPSPFVPPLDFEGLWSTARVGFASFVARMSTWRERARERRELRQLSDDMLRDVGISRAQALGEAAKPFWRA